ncbi:MAG TPA: hypothetical protein VFN67_13880 [Polyangiales bacterium]|nr:hypothetical protein [Polyangiales bacterium]
MRRDGKLGAAAGSGGEVSVNLSVALTLGIDLPLIGFIGFRHVLIEDGAADPLPDPPAHRIGWPEHTRLRISTAMSDTEGTLNTTNDPCN